jgi:alpha-amylase
MGVIMQAFYWDCPKDQRQEFQWWPLVRQKVAGLRQAGFTALWLPPACKAASVVSMGYDPYDYYDLGEFNQKGGTATWFGSKVDLLALLAEAHAQGMQVYADVVLNHNSGGEAEVNPMTGQSGWTFFQPASGLFARDWRCFHPCEYESWDGWTGGTCGDMPDLCHRAPDVYSAVVQYARWLIEKIGFDGFRFDMVKGYGAWVVGSLQEVRYRRVGDQYFKPFGVGEFWDSDVSIRNWLSSINDSSDNPVSAFDFDLRYRLRDLCDQGGFSLRTLAAPGTLMGDCPAQAVTFVENHDVARGDPVVNDKLLAYAFILTHEGYPCVFWPDYFNYGLALPGTRNGIAALVDVHEKLAGGPTEVLYVDDNLYVMQRGGAGVQSGLVLVLNNRGNTWNGTRARTRWPNARFTPAAWWSHGGQASPAAVVSDGAGWADLWAPPRGYAVYAPGG